MIIGAYIALIGTTYAYYQIRIIENKTEKGISGEYEPKNARRAILITKYKTLSNENDSRQNMYSKGLIELILFLWKETATDTWQSA